jgi:hypothetical protein
MGEHAGQQALAPPGKQAEQTAVDHDGDHRFAVVSVREAESHALQDQAGNQTAAPGAELAHERYTEDQLFTKSC